MDPGAKARGSDREAAIRLVRDACTQGRITELDRDFRISALGDAQTLGEIEVHVRDLRGPSSASEPPAWARPDAVSEWPAPGATGSDGAQESDETPVWPPRAPAAHVPTPPPKTGMAVAKVVLILLVIFFCCIIGSVLGTVALLVGSINDAVREGVDDTSLAPGPRSADLLTEEGYDELVAVVRDETGSSRVLQADIYADHASFGVLRSDGETEALYRWGSSGLREVSERTYEGDTRPVDLATIDGADIERLSEEAERTLFDDPDQVYTMIWRPRPGERGVIWSNARQDGRSAYLLSRADGSLVRKSE